MARRIILLSCLAACILLTVCSGTAMQAARAGFSLFSETVLPALLPYFVCTALMARCARPGAGSQWLLLGLSLISGAPSGARYSASLPDDGGAFKTRLAAALNAASPAFIAGAFCTGCLGRTELAAPLLIGQYVSSAVMLVPLIRRIRHALPKEDEAAEALPSLPEAIRSSMAALISICGTIVAFSVLIRLADVTGILDILCFPFVRLTEALGGQGSAVRAAVTGLFEMVTGTGALAACGLPVRAALAAASFLFAFGGLCVMAQSLTFVRLKPLVYIISKLIQGAVAGVTVYLITPWFLGAEEAISLIDGKSMLDNAAVTAAALAAPLFGMAVVLLVAAAAGAVARRSGKTRAAVRGAAAK